MKIAVIGDLNGRALKEMQGFSKKERLSFYDSFVKHFFSIPADLYVSIGDLTNSASTDDLKYIYSVIQQYDKEFVHVLGSRDFDSMSRKEVLEITQQERFHMITTDTAVLAFLDTTQKPDTAACQDQLDLVQQQWLDTLIERSDGRPLIVFGQHAERATDKNLGKGKRCIPPPIPLWETLKSKAGAGLYVSGHHHSNSIAVQEQWTFLQIAAVLDEQAVRIIDISESLIRIDYIPFTSSYAEETAWAFGTGKEYTLQSPHPLGKEADVKYAIPLPVSSESKAPAGKEMQTF